MCLLIDALLQCIFTVRKPSANMKISTQLRTALATALSAVASNEPVATGKLLTTKQTLAISNTIAPNALGFPLSLLLVFQAKVFIDALFLKLTKGGFLLAF